ncbi:hypothetical protein AB4440_10990 [Vibrio splendidus]|uniref:hypothetical protein n=1 Tax=Vibrio splendidus TaxID=29497 RepID=UPI000C862410|nr:hypothetical protein [Vibrio splendidus]PMO94893.1 hypothetical protein BCS97_15830 [Vibrio splendidus]PMP34959.1 hypothetical protein BCS89_01075 [Vibrio splendidus]PMP36507.1 hypothetical protein BCS88_06255 [Vibrio splendidus]PMP38057.1 hypothetical protein BCS87_13900 [Vibrio splendidus]PMP48602.1 hypothetical protein BCS85_09325 [Vibrio splendidus]
MKNSMLNNPSNDKSSPSLPSLSHENDSCEKYSLTDIEDRILRLKSLNDFLNSGNKWPESAVFELQDEQTNIINDLANSISGLFSSSRLSS